MRDQDEARDEQTDRDAEGMGQEHGGRREGGTVEDEDNQQDKQDQMRSQRRHEQRCQRTEDSSQQPGRQLDPSAQREQQEGDTDTGDRTKTRVGENEERCEQHEAGNENVPLDAAPQTPDGNSQAYRVKRRVDERRTREHADGSQPRRHAEECEQKFHDEQDEQVRRERGWPQHNESKEINRDGARDYRQRQGRRHTCRKGRGELGGRRRRHVSRTRRRPSRVTVGTAQARREREVLQSEGTQLLVRNQHLRRRRRVPVLGLTDALELAAGKAFETTADDPAAVPEGRLEEGCIVAPRGDHDAAANQLVKCSVGARADRIVERAQLGTARDAATEKPTDLETSETPNTRADDEALDVGHRRGSASGLRRQEHDAETALAAQRVRDGNVDAVTQNDVTSRFGKRRRGSRRKQVDDLVEHGARTFAKRTDARDTTRKLMVDRPD